MRIVNTRIQNLRVVGQTVVPADYTVEILAVAGGGGGGGHVSNPGGQRAGTNGAGGVIIIRYKAFPNTVTETPVFSIN